MKDVSTDHDETGARRRRTWARLAAAAGLLVGAAAFLHERDSAGAVATALEPATGRGGPGAAVSRDARRDTVTAPRRLVASYRIEPERVCVGQTALAQVRLRHGIDARVSIMGRSGERLALSFESPGLHRVPASVAAWDGGRQQLEAEVTVEECPGRPRVDVSHEFSTSRDDTVIFHVDRVEGLGEGLRYDWTVDGADTVTTEDGYLDWSVALRDQSGPTTSMLLSLVVTDETGRMASTSHSVSVVNPSWLLARGGTWRLPVQASHFPREDADGYVVPVTLRNVFARGDVRLDGARIDGLPCEDPDDRRSLWLGSDRALSATLVEEGATLEAEFRAPRTIDGVRLCTLEVTLLGSFDSGDPVEAAFVLETGIHPAFSEPATAAVARVGLHALVEAGLTRLDDEEMKLLLGRPRGDSDVLLR